MEHVRNLRKPVYLLGRDSDLGLAGLFLRAPMFGAGSVVDNSTRDLFGGLLCSGIRYQPCTNPLRLGVRAAAYKFGLILAYNSMTARLTAEAYRDLDLVA